MAALLNARFRNGHPSTKLSEAGLLIRCFDGYEDPHRPWLPNSLQRLQAERGHEDGQKGGDVPFDGTANAADRTYKKHLKYMSPMVMASFTIIPYDFRAPFMSSCQIPWNSFLSYMKNCKLPDQDFKLADAK